MTPIPDRESALDFAREIHGFCYAKDAELTRDADKAWSNLFAVLKQKVGVEL